jgi:hypothetical protein
MVRIGVQDAPVRLIAPGACGPSGTAAPGVEGTSVPGVKGMTAR